MNLIILISVIGTLYVVGCKEPEGIIGIQFLSSIWKAAIASSYIKHSMANVKKMLYNQPRKPL